MPLILDEKEAALWTNKTENIRVVKIAFPGKEEKEVYKEGKSLYAMQLDFAHAKVKNIQPLWMTVEYFTTEEEAIKVVKKQAEVITEIGKMFDKMGELLNRDRVNKETNQNLN